MAFEGQRVMAFESRRAVEIAELIRRQGGDPFVAPAVREVPVEDNHEAFAFAERLFAGEFDMMILLTGVGTRALAEVLGSRYGPDRFPEALRQMTTVARGPKPAAALRELQAPATVIVGEPNTWHQVVEVVAARGERRIAVQEYGEPSPELLAALEALGARVSTVAVYQWAMPVDTAPLREAVQRLVSGAVDVALFTASIQVRNLFQIAALEGVEDQLQAAFGKVAVGSIGPTTTATLQAAGVIPALEPSHPKMGLLVKEMAERCPTTI